MAPVRRTAVISAVVLAVAGGAALGSTDAGRPAPAFAETFPPPLSAEVAQAATAQAEADSADREAIAQLTARAQQRDAEIAAERARQAAEEAAAAQAAAQAAAEQEFRQAQLTLRAQSDPKGVAAELVAERGWGGDQMVCLDKLWTRESDWNHTAANPTSSAYGIPQALPGRKMASAGADWQTNPATQIQWGLGYIAEVYGSPCKAWAHSEAVNWY